MDRYQPGVLTRYLVVWISHPHAIPSPAAQEDVGVVDGHCYQTEGQQRGLEREEMAQLWRSRCPFIRTAIQLTVEAQALTLLICAALRNCFSPPPPPLLLPGALLNKD